MPPASSLLDTHPACNDDRRGGPGRGAHDPVGAIVDLRLRRGPRDGRALRLDYIAAGVTRISVDRHARA